MYNNDHLNYCKLSSLIQFTILVFFRNTVKTSATSTNSSLQKRQIWRPPTNSSWWIWIKQNSRDSPSSIQNSCSTFNQVFSRKLRIRMKFCERFSKALLKKQNKHIRFRLGSIKRSLVWIFSTLLYIPVLLLKNFYGNNIP